MSRSEGEYDVRLTLKGGEIVGSPVRPCWERVGVGVAGSERGPGVGFLVGVLGWLPGVLVGVRGGSGMDLLFVGLEDIFELVTSPTAGRWLCA